MSAPTPAVSTRTSCARTGEEKETTASESAARAARGGEGSIRFMRGTSERCLPSVYVAAGGFVRPVPPRLRRIRCASAALRRSRQGDDERGACPELGFHAHRAAELLFGHGAHHREPRPRTFDLRREARLEDPLMQVRGDPGPLV